MTNKNRIKNITSALNKNRSKFTSMGVLDGIAGLSLYYYYLAKFKENEQLKEEAINYLASALEGLNEIYQGNSIERDILEISRLLFYYQKEEFLDQSDVDGYFESFDPILLEIANEKLKIEEINPFFGAIAYGYYFLQRDNNDEFINSLINTIEKLSHEDKSTGGIFWFSDMKRDESNLIELSGNHGIAGIIQFLLMVYEFGCQKNRIKNLIEKGLSYIADKEVGGGTSLYPFNSESIVPQETINLAYGDLSIGNVFYKAGSLFEKEEYLSLGKRIIINASLYRDDNEENVKDANLLYGSSGLSSFFQFYQIKFKSEKLSEAITYWNNKSLSFRRNQNESAGFETNYNRFDVNAPYSLSHGIIGIGITKMQNELSNKNFDYLTFFNF